MACRHGCCASNREHWLSVAVSGAATPTRSPEVARVAATEKRWERDMPAYKRLRGDGLQPKNIDGSGDLEARAVDRNEIEIGHIIDHKPTRDRVVEEMTRLQAMQ